MLEREVDKMLKDMMQNPIARTNVISPVNNESGGNQVSFKKQNQSILDKSNLDDNDHDNDNEDEDEILTHRTTKFGKSFTNKDNKDASETKRQKDRKKTLVRLGIRDEADLIKGNMQCVKMLIIQDFIIVVCKHLKLMVYKKDVLEGYYLNETVDMHCL